MLIHRRGQPVCSVFAVVAVRLRKQNEWVVKSVDLSQKQGLLGAAFVCIDLADEGAILEHAVLLTVDVFGAFGALLVPQDIGGRRNQLAVRFGDPVGPNGFGGRVSQPLGLVFVAEVQGLG